MGAGGQIVVCAAPASSCKPGAGVVSLSVILGSIPGSGILRGDSSGGSGGMKQCACEQPGAAEDPNGRCWVLSTA